MVTTYQIFVNQFLLFMKIEFDFEIGEFETKAGNDAIGKYTLCFLTFVNSSGMNNCSSQWVGSTVY